MGRALILVSRLSRFRKHLCLLSLCISLCMSLSLSLCMAMEHITRNPNGKGDDFGFKT